LECGGRRRFGFFLFLPGKKKKAEQSGGDRRTPKPAAALPLPNIGRDTPFGETHFLS